MHRSTLLSFTLIAIAFTSLSSSQAAILALYTFDSIAFNASPSSDTDPNSVASDIAAGTGVAMVSSGTGNPFPSGAMQQATATSEATAVSGNDYYQFTLTANVGFLADLTSLTLDLQRNASNSPTTMFIRSSVDSFGSTLLLDNTLPTAPTAFETVTLNLSAPSFQGLSAITFRLYAFGASSATSSLRFDNVTLNGTVSAIPEPSCAFILTLSAGLMLVMRKRAIGF